VLRQAERPSPDLPAELPDLLPDIQSEERDRSVWARAGILVNELACPALFLNLPTRWGACLAAVDGRPVYVCENSNIVAIAADRLGSHCARLICTDGMLAAAQRALLTQLARAGARLLYHGDFDWPGLCVATVVIRSCGAEPDSEIHPQGGGWLGDENPQASAACLLEFFVADRDPPLAASLKG
jgi:hypothetical protein